MGNSCGKSCGHFLRENLVGQGGGKSQFKKGSDWWKFSIWNRVMGSKPIRIQLGKSCGKILQEILAGNSCGKFLQENLAGKFCGKILWEILRKILAGKACGKSCGKGLWEILQENLVGNLAGQGGGEKANLRKAVIGGNLTFGIG